MDRGEIYHPAITPDTFNAPLRNVRVYINGTSITLDLIPEYIPDEIHEGNDPSQSPEVNRLLTGTRPIIESKKIMRVSFRRISAIIVHEEFVDIVEEVRCNSDKVPRMIDSEAWCPFVRVENSKWRKTIPDYQSGNDPELLHFKIFSMETNVDVIAYLDSFKWIEAPRE